MDTLDIKAFFSLLFLLTLDVWNEHRYEISIAYCIIMIFEFYIIGVWAIMHFYLGLIFGRKGIFLAMGLLNIYILYYRDFYQNKFGKYSIWS